MMKNNVLKRAAAAVLAVTLIGCGTAFPVGDKPLFGSSLTADAAEYCCSFNNSTGVLTLRGNVVKEDVQEYYSGDVEHEGFFVTKVVCEEGTVFPEDSSWLFSEFRSANEIDLSNADTSKVTNMENMFHCCWNLRNINLSNIDTSNVTSMKEMFYLCKSLTSIDVSRFDTSNVTNMNGMFGACEKLKKLDLRNFNTSNVNDMSGIFHICESLTDLDISSFDTHNVNDMSCMFLSCVSLTDLDISHFDTRNVNSMIRMFDSCYELSNLKLGNFNTSNVSDKYGMYGMFSYCKKLTSLDLSCFDTSNVIDMRYMFANCESLAYLNLSSFDTSNVKKMGNMFCNCKSLKKIDLSSFDTKKVTDITKMFTSCTNLESIIVSNTWTNSSVTEGDNVFDGCTSLIGGSGTAYDPDKTDYTYACADTEETPGYLTLIHRENMLKKASVTLDGTIGINFYTYINEDIEKAVISGPNGDEVTDFTDKEPSGTTKLTYKVYATQTHETITLKLYGKNGEQMSFIKAGRTPASVSQYTCTVQDYIDKYKSEYSSGKVYDLVNSLDNYCKAAENYFKGTSNTINGIDDVTADNVKMYAPVLDENIKLSLVLFSSTNIRVYTDSTDVVLYGNDMTPHTSRYGQYYEFYNAPANRLFEKISVVIDGKNCAFYAMSYVYRVLNNPDLDEDSPLVKMAKATYVYAQAAKAYLGT